MSSVSSNSNLSASKINMEIKKGNLQSVKDWCEIKPWELNEQHFNSNTALHYACKHGELEIVEYLLGRDGIRCDLKNVHGRIPLHNAALQGSPQIVTCLVEKLPVSCITAPDNKGETPVHFAAKEGHLEVLKVMVEKDENCLKAKGHCSETPLHRAAEYRHFDVVQMILNARNQPDINELSLAEETSLHSAAKGRSLEIVKCLWEKGAIVDQQSKDGETPLHLAAKGGSLEIVKFLCKKGATIHQESIHGQTPLHYAAKGGSLEIVDFFCNLPNVKIPPFPNDEFYGQLELKVANYLLEKGVKVSNNCFRKIVDEEKERHAMAVITRSKAWPEALRGKYCCMGSGEPTTAFRELIKKMPDVAKEVLDKCTIEEDRSDESSHRALHSYEFIEDYEDLLKSGETKEKTSGSPFNYESFAESFSAPSWETAGGRLPTFSRETHPLQIMVDNEQLDLLSHPVVESLIRYKWIKFGLFTYLFNLLTYTFYLSLLTTFALTVPSPQSKQCNFSDNYNLTEREFCPEGEGFKTVTTISVLVLVLAFIQLMVELVQVVMQRFRYLEDWNNWVQTAQYLCTVVFVWVFHNPCLCVLNWQWQVGVVSVFLGWILLIMLASILPKVGIYVVILQRISWTFAKIIVLSIFLVVTFAITLHMVFFDSGVMRSPFSDIPRSILKTMTMATGEFEYDGLFRLDPSGGSDDSAEIKYPLISYVIWITFVIFMPLILINMLTSLAIGDTGEAKKEAHRRKLAIQIDQILFTQELLRVFRKCLPIKLRYYKHYRIINPNMEVEKSRLTRMIAMIKTKFVLMWWEEEQYEKSEVETVGEKIKSEVSENIREEIQEFKSEVSKEIHAVKDELKKLIIEVLVKRAGSDVAYDRLPSMTDERTV